jgi:hypothetical protein
MNNGKFMCNQFDAAQWLHRLKAVMPASTIFFRQF